MMSIDEFAGGNPLLRQKKFEQNEKKQHRKTAMAQLT
jgi:hypothetical protein